MKKQDRTLDFGGSSFREFRCIIGDPDPVFQGDAKPSEEMRTIETMGDGESPKRKDSKTFEESFDRLVEVVEKLEIGEGSLTEMTALFEEGVALSKACSNELDSVERKVEILLGEGEEGIAPFETGGEE